MGKTFPYEPSMAAGVWYLWQSRSYIRAFRWGRKKNSRSSRSGREPERGAGEAEGNMPWDRKDQRTQVRSVARHEGGKTRRVYTVARNASKQADGSQ